MKQTEPIVEPAPRPRMRVYKLKEEDKSLIDALRVGDGLSFKNKNLAMCAVERMRGAGRNATTRKNDDGTVNVWRVS